MTNRILILSGRIIRVITVGNYCCGEPQSNFLYCSEKSEEPRNPFGNYAKGIQTFEIGRRLLEREIEVKVWSHFPVFPSKDIFPHFLSMIFN